MRNANATEGRRASPIRTTQSALARWIRAPEGVATAVCEQADARGDDRGVDPDTATATNLSRPEHWIRGDATLDATGRLEIYANAYFYRLLGVLTEDFEALATAIGRDVFHDLVTSYLLIEPPTHASLRYAGLKLPDFLASDPAAETFRARAPWSADLASFEWARCDAFDAAEGTPLTRGSVAVRDPSEFASLRLELGPWALLRSFEHPVDAIWAATLRDGKMPSPEDSTEAVFRCLIWRRSERVVQRRLDALEEGALSLASLGTTFGALCEWAAERVDEQAAPRVAVQWLEQWLADGLLSERAD